MPPHRNMVVLLPHGLRADALGDSNAWPVLTPNMEKLGRRGLRLVATSACPADYGGVSCLLTGLHGRQSGLSSQGWPERCAGFPAWLRATGYHLAGVGNVQSIRPWLHEAVQVDPVEVIASEGCEYLRAMAAKGELPAIQQQRRQRLRYGPFDPDRLLLAPDSDIDGFIYTQARRLLIQMPSDRPWALIVLFSGPANDLAPPFMYSDAVDPHLVEDGFALSDFRHLDDLAELDYPRTLLQRLDPTRLGRIRADYLGRVCLVDFGIGRLGKELATRPDAHQTWVILASDRGALLGEHGLIGHRSFLSAALETPLIIAPPQQVKEQTHDTAMISTVDVAATIAALGGCDLPAGSVGRSLLPLIQHESIPSLIARGGGSIAEFGRRLMLETERFRVIFNTEDGNALGLYDLLNDPGERDNLVHKMTGRNVLDSLRWRLGEALLPIKATAV